MDVTFTAADAVCLLSTCRERVPTIESQLLPVLRSETQAAILAASLPSPKHESSLNAAVVGG